MAHQQLYSTIAEKPDADISEIQIIVEKIGKRIHGRLLQHTFQDRRILREEYKHAVIFRYFRSQPKSIAQLNIRNGLQRFCGTDINIATHNHGYEYQREQHSSSVHKADLKRKQILKVVVRAPI